MLVLLGLEVVGGVGEDAAGRSYLVGFLGVELVVNLVVGSGVLPGEEGAFGVGHEGEDAALVGADGGSVGFGAVGVEGVLASCWRSMLIAVAKAYLLVVAAEELAFGVGYGDGDDLAFAGEGGVEAGTDVHPAAFITTAVVGAERPL